MQDIGAHCLVPGKELSVLPGLCDQTCLTITPALIFWRVYLGERLCTGRTITERGDHPHSCVQFKGLKTLSYYKIQINKQTNELMERLPPHTRAESEQTNGQTGSATHTQVSLFAADVRSLQFAILFTVSPSQHDYYTAHVLGVEFYPLQILKHY